MSVSSRFGGLKVPFHAPTAGRRRYSVTGDILAYELCSLQYAAFAVRKYEPALVVQLFYGTIIHQVLDRAHAHYRGELGVPRGSMPTKSDIDRYFSEVENALMARRIRAVSKVRDQARGILHRFNEIEGPALYPRVLDTECRLQADQGAFILHGNVDVLVASEDGNAASVEIWDYKGASKPSASDPSYQRYVFQMQVYAELYRQKTGVAPAKAVLYFLNELSGFDAPTARPANALLEVNLEPAAVTTALGSFARTVSTIESCRSTGQWPQPIEAPPEKTCSACDLRWNCAAARKFGRSYELKHP